MKLWWCSLDWRIAAAPLAFFGLALALDRTPWFSAVAWQSLDLRTQLRAAWGQPPPHEDIAVVGIADRSTNTIGQWPFQRAWHANLQLLLAHTPPSVMAWDIIFADRRDVNGDKWDPDSDADLVATTELLREQGVPAVFAAVSGVDPTGEDATATGLTSALPNVVGDRSKLWGDPELTMPFPELRPVATFGLVDAPRGAGGVVRRMPLVLRVGERVLPAFALQVAMQHWRVAPEEVRVVLGDAIYVPRGKAGGEARIPIDEAGRFLINYRYETMAGEAEVGREIFTVESFDLIVGLSEKYQTGNVEAEPPEDLSGKVVLVGEFSTDVGPSPRVALSPLVLVHANILNNILAEDYARQASPGWVWGGWLVLGYVALYGVGRRSAGVLIVFTILILGGYTVVCFWAWIAHSVWWPWVSPSLGFVGLQYFVITRRVRLEQAAREGMKRMFGSYLSPGLLAKMSAEGAQALIGGERRVVTILFSDLRDFTSWSERTPEEVLIAQLNEYLGAMVECIHAEHGTLHKFIGDAVMAVWGDIGSQGEAADARRAARAALGMARRLEELNAGWAAAGRHTLKMGIGLNTGRVVVGNVGSPERMEFTVIGDAVNLAARLESLTKEQGVGILVGATTAGLLGDEFMVKPRGEVAVKGKAAAVPVFALEGAAPNEVGGAASPDGS